MVIGKAAKRRLKFFKMPEDQDRWSGASTAILLVGLHGFEGRGWNLSLAVA